MEDKFKAMPILSLGIFINNAKFSLCFSLSLALMVQTLLGFNNSFEYCHHQISQLHCCIWNGPSYNGSVNLRKKMFSFFFDPPSYFPGEALIVQNCKKKSKKSIVVCRTLVKKLQKSQQLAGPCLKKTHKKLVVGLFPPGLSRNY